MKGFIEPYNPDWKTTFETIKQALELRLSDLKPLIDIQHVGSTSVPGLFAKPIIDVDIIIDNKNLIGDVSQRLEDLGYKNKGEQGVSGRFAFRQTSGSTGSTPFTMPSHMWQPHHLYVCYADSLAVKNHLLFRNTLRKDSELIEKYSALKNFLAHNPEMTREEYTKQKTDFIISVLATAGLDETELKEIALANT